MCCFINEEQVGFQNWLGGLPSGAATLYKPNQIFITIPFVFFKYFPVPVGEVFRFNSYSLVIDETQMIDLVPYLEGKMTETKRWLGRWLWLVGMLRKRAGLRIAAAA